jgi:aminotransferase
LYWIQTERRDELARFLLENDIYTTFRYYPLHLVGHYGSDASLPNAESVNETTLCLPLHQNLSNSDVSYIVDKVQEFFGG